MSFVLSEITEVSVKQEDASSGVEVASKPGSVLQSGTVADVQDRAPNLEESYLNDSSSAMPAAGVMCECGRDCSCF